ncbi:MAG TPA: Ig-like domain-containing protein [bacterium]|nr:Ig-like domain-containing protein [bacterium]
MLRPVKIVLFFAILGALAGCGRKATPPGDRALEGGMPPRMVFFRLLDSRHIQLEFDRALDPAPLKETGNFILTGGEGGEAAEVVLAKLDQATGRRVVLDVAGLEPGATYTLRTRNLRSGEGLPLEPLEREFIADAPADETPPRAVSTFPEERAPDQPAVYAWFSEAVRLAPDASASLAEILPAAEPVTPTEGETSPDTPPPEEQVALGPETALELRVEGDRVFLSLPATLDPAKRYQVTLDGVVDLGGNATEEPVTWRFGVTPAEEGYTLAGEVFCADGTPLPADLAVSVSKDPAGELPLARAVLDSGAFEIRGLTPTDARSSPYVTAVSAAGGWRFEDAYDENSDGAADRLGAADAGELKTVRLTLRRRDVQGPELGLEKTGPSTGSTAAVTVTAVDDTGVALVEAFLDTPGNDGAGTALTVPPWLGLSGDRRLTACLAVPTADWDPGEAHTLIVHARDTFGNWSGFSTLALAKGEEEPLLTGKAVYAGEPVEGAAVALVADPPGRPLAFDTTDPYGRYTLPDLPGGARIIVWKEGEGLLLGRGGTERAEEVPVVELEPWPVITQVACSLVRYAPTAELALPGDHLLVEARVEAPTVEGRGWNYALELGEASHPVGPPLAGKILAYLDRASVELPADTAPRLLVTPVDAETGEPVGEPVPWRSNDLDLAELPFTKVSAVDEGTTVRISWEPLYGVAGYYVAVVPAKAFDAQSLPDAGVWRTYPELVRTGELVIPEGDLAEYWGVPGGTRYVVAVCAVWTDEGDRSWSFGELVHP